MSILIKGMEMPKDGAYSIVHIYSDGHVSMPFWGKGMQIVSGITAVPVPPHGDLIDRKAAYDSLLYGMVMTGYQSRALDCVAEYAVPTVIPADKDGRT